MLACSEMHLRSAFFRCKHCAHDGCVDLNYVGTLRMVYFGLSFIYK